MAKFDRWWHFKWGVSASRLISNLNDDNAAARLHLLTSHTSPCAPELNGNEGFGGSGAGAGQFQGGNIGTGIEAVGGRMGDTREGSGEEGDAGDDQEGDDGEGAEANNATIRCSCVICNLHLDSADIVLIPNVGHAHRACAEDYIPGISIAPRARQQPIRLVPAFNGTSHHQRDAEATRPILPLTHQQPLPPLPTRPRTTAPSGRRRGGVGQGRGPDEEPDRRAGDASRVSFSDMQGLWLALRDGRRCLVVATGICLFH